MTWYIVMPGWVMMEEHISQRFVVFESYIYSEIIIVVP